MERHGALRQPLEAVELDARLPLVDQRRLRRRGALGIGHAPLDRRPLLRVSQHGGGIAESHVVGEREHALDGLALATQLHLCPHPVVEEPDAAGGRAHGHHAAEQLGPVEGELLPDQRSHREPDDSDRGVCRRPRSARRRPRRDRRSTRAAARGRRSCRYRGCRTSCCGRSPRSTGSDTRARCCRARRRRRARRCRAPRRTARSRP